MDQEGKEIPALRRFTLENQINKKIKMANPALNEKIFRNACTVQYSESMTVKGTLTKSILLLLMVIAGAAYTWKIYYQAIDPSSVTPWMIGGLIGGLISTLIISFKPTTSPYMAPVYALCEGFALGGISASFNNVFAHTAPNIVINAALLTFLTAFVMFIIFRTGIIKVNSRFTKIIIAATGAIALYYIATIILSLFGVNMAAFTSATPLGIGISLVIVGVAAFSLLLDYKFIEDAAYAGAPKYMEWYGAFGLMVTLVWLYLEILKLLAQFASNRE